MLSQSRVTLAAFALSVCRTSFGRTFISPKALLREWRIFIETIIVLPKVGFLSLVTSKSKVTKNYVAMVKKLKLLTIVKWVVQVKLLIKEKLLV